MAKKVINAPSLMTTASEGDRLETLKALRHHLAYSIEKSESVRDVAQLSNQMMKCLSEVESLEGSKVAKPDTSKMSPLERVMAEGKAAKAG